MEKAKISREIKIVGLMALFWIAITIVGVWLIISHIYNHPEKIPACWCGQGSPIDVYPLTPQCIKFCEL